MDHVCVNCHKGFPSSSKLARHRARKTPCIPGPPPSTKCPRCSHEYATPGSLQRHLKRGCMWAGEPADKTQCPTCLKKFAHTSARNTHVRNGCPATKPGGESALAKETRRLQTEKQRLQERLRGQEVELGELRSRLAELGAYAKSSPKSLPSWETI